MYRHVEDSLHSKRSSRKRRGYFSVLATPTLRSLLGGPGKAENRS